MLHLRSRRLVYPTALPEGNRQDVSSHLELLPDGNVYPREEPVVHAFSSYSTPRIAFLCTTTGSTTKNYVPTFYYTLAAN